MAWIATKHFTYGEHELFPGEFLEPRGLRNDRLIFSGESRYVQVVAKEHDEWPCDRCGRRFMDESQLRGHQRRAYAAEQDSPERQKEQKRQVSAHAERALKNETITDVARRVGHDVEERGGVPTIVPG